MIYLLKQINPVAIGHRLGLSAFIFILFEGITVVSVWCFIVSTALFSLGIKYMRYRVKNEVQAKLDSLGVKVVHVAYIGENEYLMVARRKEDGTSFYLSVDKNGNHCPFDSDAYAINNLKHTGKF
ncbi:hypothetical protein C9975_03030 [Thalassospira xiamenensis]|nr:hypothetical protein C9975_03030 [Thalassospira xiamenensis]